MSKLNSDTILEVFVSASGDIYKQISYCEHPTVCIENVITGERQTHVVDCMNIESMDLEPIREMKKDNLVDVVSKLANMAQSMRMTNE